MTPGRVDIVGREAQLELLASIGAETDTLAAEAVGRDAEAR